MDLSQGKGDPRGWLHAQVPVGRICMLFPLEVGEGGQMRFPLQGNLKPGDSAFYQQHKMSLMLSYQKEPRIA